MPDGTPTPDAERAPAGRLRLAAALGGAGMLAIGMGAGVMQASGQDQAASTTSAPGAGALEGQEPSPSTATAAPASTSSTADTAAPATTTSTPVAEPAAEQPAEQPATPAADQPAAPAEQPAQQPEQPAALGDLPAAETPADQAATPAAKPAEEAEPEKECKPGFEEVLTVQGADEADDELRCERIEKPKPRKRRKGERRHAGHGHADPKVDQRPVQQPIRSASGVPTVANPTTSIVMPGPAAIGVPNFFIDKFRIPPFLLPIYQAAGMEYGIRWEVLAAINEIETDYGRNLNVSSAGALGWMQFMPATWKQYGVDANGDGKKDPYNPVDAIFAAAKYLKAAGGHDDLRKAIFAYNHADWYVDSVLMRARLVGGLPADLVGSLTGLTEGRFPIVGRARYADDLDERKATRRIARGSNAAIPVTGDATRRGIDVFAPEMARAVATHDGKIVKRGVDERLGRFVQIRDAHGNTYTYGHLGKLEALHPVPKRGAKPAPVTPKPADGEAVEPRAGDVAGKERIFAHPHRPRAYSAGGRRQVGDAVPEPVGREEYARELLHLDNDEVTWQRLKPGSHVVAGTVLGYLGKTSSTLAPHLHFEIRPAGRGAPRIDPKPILDGWQLLETTAIYRASAKNPFHGRDAKAATVGQILLMSKDALQRRVLENPRIAIYERGRLDIRAGLIDRRVLALLEYLAANGIETTVSSLLRPGSITVSGNVSHHSTGSAVDISAVNGVPVIGHQGEGSVTDIAIRRILNLQGAMKPDQIISLMTYPAADNTYAMGDHADHIHVGFSPVGGEVRGGRAVTAELKPGQWFRVMDRLSEIENPVVPAKPSSVSLTVKPKKHAAATARGHRRRRAGE